ncbi:hypothetical protein E1171_00950, partial [Cytophagales bacterium RKSG123]|nr:hypothetical protein [Xanthovirga aplysinae]
MRCGKKELVILLLSLIHVTQLFSSPFFISGSVDDSLGTDHYNPVSDFDYIPDAPYEVIKERFSSLNTNFPLTINGKVKSFIDY